MCELIFSAQALNDCRVWLHLNKLTKNVVISFYKINHHYAVFINCCTFSRIIGCVFVLTLMPSFLLLDSIDNSLIIGIVCLAL